MPKPSASLRPSQTSLGSPHSCGQGRMRVSGMEQLLIPGGGAVLVAVSGGPDSMCLADLFLRSGKPFAVAHCNFRLRGEESDGDERLVRDWCAGNGVRCFVKAFDTEGYAAGHSQSIEMAARELRYRWFGELCKAEGFEGVAVAHNAQDNAETLILNLLRGTGLRGITGMPVCGYIPDPEYSSVRLYRPLLAYSREDIEAHNREFSVPSRQDATNGETVYRRNKIRHMVFPIFKEINPSFLSTFSGDMARFSQAQTILDEWFGEELARVSDASGYVSSALLEASLHKDYFLYRFLSGYGFNPSVIEDVSRLLESGGTVSGKVFRSEGYELVMASSKLIIRPLQQAVGPGSILVAGPGEYILGGSVFTVEVAQKEELPGFKTPGITALDASVMPFPFLVRRPSPGDWFQPLGLRGRKKLSDLFVDLKYSLPDKEAALVVVPADGDSHIAALAGSRIDEKYKVKDTTRNCIKITLK